MSSLGFKIIVGVFIVLTFVITGLSIAIVVQRETIEKLNIEIVNLNRVVEIQKKSQDLLVQVEQDNKLVDKQMERVDELKDLRRFITSLNPRL